VVPIATVAAEAAWAANGNQVSSDARQGIANVAMNRVGVKEWAHLPTVAEVCQSGFDAYGNDDYINEGTSVEITYFAGEDYEIVTEIFALNL